MRARARATCEGEKARGDAGEANEGRGGCAESKKRAPHSSRAPPFYRDPPLSSPPPARALRLRTRTPSPPPSHRPPAPSPSTSFSCLPSLFVHRQSPWPSPRATSRSRSAALGRATWAVSGVEGGGGDGRPGASTLANLGRLGGPPPTTTNLPPPTLRRRHRIAVWPLARGGRAGAARVDGGRPRIAREKPPVVFRGPPPPPSPPRSSPFARQCSLPALAEPRGDQGRVSGGRIGARDWLKRPRAAALPPPPSTVFARSPPTPIDRPSPPLARCASPHTVSWPRVVWTEGEATSAGSWFAGRPARERGAPRKKKHSKKHAHHHLSPPFPPGPTMAMIAHKCPHITVVVVDINQVREGEKGGGRKGARMIQRGGRGDRYSLFHHTNWCARPPPPLPTRDSHHRHPPLSSPFPHA